MYMYNLFADLSEKTKDSVTPFIIVNLSNDQYLEFPENHVVAFAEKDNMEGEVFRWFKFTLKPPNSMACWNCYLAFWDTFHWNIFVKFGLKTPYDIS